MNNYKIECNNVSKKFRWYERSLSVKESFTRIFKKSNQKWEWYVLKNINFKMKVGEHLGIIGKNGSGKTTLLKLFSSIYVPSKGTININCNRRLALIELGVGIYPELTGRENILLNWVFNGLPKKELKHKFDKIVQFAEVERLIDTPLKFYSSGMTARLGFSIAINADPDLLIIDEILAVGDAEFKKRCYEEIKKLCEKGITMILVSHNEDDIKRVCSRVIWLDEGIVKADGETTEVLDSYKKALTI